MSDDDGNRSKSRFLDRRPTRLDVRLALATLVLGLGGLVAGILMTGVGESWPLPMLMAVATERVTDACWFAGPALAAVVLPVLALGRSARRRWLWTGAFLTTWVLLAGFVGPSMKVVIAEWVQETFVRGVGFSMPPQTWTWAELLRAVTAARGPDGGLVDAYMVETCRSQLSTAAVTLVAIVLVLTPVLLRRSLRVPWWASLLIAVVFVAFGMRMDGMAVRPGLAPAALLIARLMVPAIVATAAWFLAASPSEPRREAPSGPRRPFGGRSVAAAALAVTVAISGLSAASPTHYSELFVQPGPVGSRAPALELAVIGDESRLALSVPGEVTVVAYWASWCGPCRAELDWLDEMLEAHGSRGLRVVAVNLGESHDAALRFWRDAGREYPPVRSSPVLLDALPSNLPASHVIDKRGIVRDSRVGFAVDRVEQYEGELLTLLAEP